MPWEHGELVLHQASGALPWTSEVTVLFLHERLCRIVLSRKLTDVSLGKNQDGVFSGFKVFYFSRS